MKKLPKSQVEFDLEISNEEVEKYFDKASQRISNDVDIKGFRKGKVPKDVLEKTIGKSAIFEEAGHFAIEKKYSDFVRENELYPIDYPKIEVKKMAPGNPIIAKVIVSVYPEIKLPKYRDIAAKEVKNRKKDFEVKDEELNSSLTYLQDSRAKEISVERESKEGDIVEVDFEVRKEGVKIEGGESKNHPVKIGDKKFMPGFEDNLVGLKAGDEKEFSLVAPKDYFKKELAGQKLDFKVKVRNVLELHKPELNDDFAKTLGGFQTLEELKKNIKEGVSKEKEEKEKVDFRNNLLEKIAKESTMDLPEVMLEKEMARMINEMKMEVEQYGLNFETYLQNLKKSEEELKKDFAPQAELRLKKSFVMSEISKAEDIKVEDEKVIEKTNEFLARYSTVAEAEKNVDLKELQAYARMLLLDERVLEFLENQK